MATGMEPTEYFLMTVKLDLKKELKSLYSAKAGQPVFVDVPPLNYLMVEGQGAPDGAEAGAAMETLFPVAYTLKFTVKKELGIDFKVMGLEGLWWSDDMTDFTAGRRECWRWIYLLPQPDFIAADLVERAVDTVRRRKNPGAIDKIKFELLDEGRAAQVLHIGPYSTEGPTIETLHRFIKENGCGFDGQLQKHHEIYLSDPRRGAPEKLKTIIRQPVA